MFETEMAWDETKWYDDEGELGERPFKMKILMTKSLRHPDDTSIMTNSDVIGVNSSPNCPGVHLLRLATSERRPDMIPNKVRS